MASNSVLVSRTSESFETSDRRAHTTVQPAVVLAGRVLYTAIFLLAAPRHFFHESIAYAAQAGVPLATIAVPLSGVVALLGGLSVLLGYRAKIGAWLIALFLVPVTLMLHNFWAVKDSMMAQMQMVMFMKNVSILGGALLISQLGSGPWSLDARRTAQPESEREE